MRRSEIEKNQYGCGIIARESRRQLVVGSKIDLHFDLIYRCAVSHVSNVALDLAEGVLEGIIMIPEQERQTVSAD